MGLINIPQTDSPFGHLSIQGQPLINDVLEVTNVEKLSQSPTTPVGFPVSVSDGFYLSGTSQDGFYTDRGDGDDGKRFYNLATIASDQYGSTAVVAWVNGAGGQWRIENNATVEVYSTENVVYPWLVTQWYLYFDDSPVSLTLTHPALQQLAAPSSAITGMFVQGAGTTEVNAVYTKRGTSGGKDYYNQLGQEADMTTYSIVWGALGGILGTGWGINGSGAVLDYYSLDAVSRPDQVTTWVAINVDQVPTVTSATTGQLIAGVKIGSVIYGVNGSQAGRNKYSDLLVSSPDIIWDDTHSKWVDGGVNYNPGDVAFPFQGTPEVTVTEDPVAAEANWTEAA